MRIADLADRRVAVWGYGREGRAALAALHVQLPALRPTLFCSPGEARIARHVEDVWGASTHQPTSALDIVTTPPDAAMLAAFEVVIKSPGISAYKPELTAAQEHGTQFVSGTTLWFAEHPSARVIAVTGTKGKSTVSALIAHLLRGLGKRVALAGNIGLPLLELLDPPQQPDWWVVELSSFQTREAVGVEVAVINNVYEEHLDWHGTRARYVEDKLALAAVARTLVVNGAQPALLELVHAHPRQLAFAQSAGWHVTDGKILRGAEVVFDLSASPLPGAHNASNLCAALAALEAAGEDARTAARTIAHFHPLPHRLQMLGEREGLYWIDDSIATTPQATLEALASLAGRAVSVLLGGFDRGLDWQPFASQVCAQPPHAIITMGASGPRIAAQLRAAGGAYRLEETTGVDAAVACARTLTPAGGVVLLSPGAPSFDQFKDYTQRGRHFAELAGFDPEAIGVIEGLGIA